MEEYKLSCVVSFSIRVSKEDAERIKQDPAAYMEHAIESGVATIDGPAQMVQISSESEQP